MFGQYQNTCLFFQFLWVTHGKIEEFVWALWILSQQQLSVSYYEEGYNMTDLIRPNWVLFDLKYCEILSMYILLYLEYKQSKTRFANNAELLYFFG